MPPVAAILPIMPYEWIIPDPAPDAPTSELHLWPYRSLTNQGFVTFISITAACISAPLIGLLGTPVLWALLPFLVAAIAAVWWALRHTHKQGETLEQLRLWDDRITLTRHNPKGPPLDWEANPHWIRVTDHMKEGPVPHYLTLQGGPRHVEIGAFLSQEERVTLRGELMDRLAGLRG